MYPESRVDRDFALRAARSLATAAPNECDRIFNSLLQRKELSHTVHHLNRLLDSDEHRPLAKRALSRLGLLFDRDGEQEGRPMARKA